MVPAFLFVLLFFWVLVWRCVSFDLYPSPGVGVFFLPPLLRTLSAISCFYPSDKKCGHNFSGIMTFCYLATKLVVNRLLVATKKLTTVNCYPALLTLSKKKKKKKGGEVTQHTFPHRPNPPARLKVKQTTKTT
jgi:hypothetical protein